MSERQFDKTAFYPVRFSSGKRAGIIYDDPQPDATLCSTASLFYADRGTCGVAGSDLEDEAYAHYKVQPPLRSISRVWKNKRQRFYALLELRNNALCSEWFFNMYVTDPRCKSADEHAAERCWRNAQSWWAAFYKLATVEDALDALK